MGCTHARTHMALGWPASDMSHGRWGILHRPCLAMSGHVWRCQLSVEQSTGGEQARRAQPSDSSMQHAALGRSRRLPQCNKLSRSSHSCVSECGRSNTRTCLGRVARESEAGQSGQGRVD